MRSSHLGMGHSVSAVPIVLDLLARPEGRWDPRQGRTDPRPHDSPAPLGSQRTGLDPTAQRPGLPLPRPARRGPSRRRSPALPRAGDPSGVDPGVDLSLAHRSHPGGRDRRRGAAPVPVPPAVAGPARRREVRPHGRLRPGVARRPGCGRWPPGAAGHAARARAGRRVPADGPGRGAGGRRGLRPPAGLGGTGHAAPGARQHCRRPRPPALPGEVRAPARPRRPGRGAGRDRARPAGPMFGRAGTAGLPRALGLGGPDELRPERLCPGGDGRR